MARKTRFLLTCNAVPLTVAFAAGSCTVACGAEKNRQTTEREGLHYPQGIDLKESIFRENSNEGLPRQARDRREETWSSKSSRFCAVSCSSRTSRVVQFVPQGVAWAERALPL